MYKKILTAVASAVMFLTAGQAVAQEITVPTDNMDGWSMDGGLINDKYWFCINSWDGSNAQFGFDAAGKFLQYWHDPADGANLPNATLKYTVTGLEPNTYYNVSALVCATREWFNRDNYPSGVSLFAGDIHNHSVDINTCTNYAVEVDNGSLHPNRGSYGTLQAIGLSNNRGELVVGININEAQYCNWVSVKDMKLSKLEVANTKIGEFERISDISNVISGDLYLIAHQLGETNGVILNGEAESVSALKSPIDVIVNTSDGKKTIFTDYTHSFTLSYNNLGTQNIQSYDITGVGSQKTIRPVSGNLQIDQVDNIRIESDGNSAFQIHRYTGNRYFLYYDESKKEFNGIQTTSDGGKVENIARPSVDLYKAKGYLNYSANEVEVIYEDRLSAELPTLDAYNFNYVFSSSNPTVATVVEGGESKGHVSIVGAGNTVIRVQGEYRPYINASYVLKVRYRGTINWNPEPEFEINQDITDRLNLWTNSNGEVTFTSSNTDVLQISPDGRTVTTVGVGTATLTASVPETNAYSAVTSSPVTITVTEPAQRSFIRISEIADIKSGANYLIVHQKAINENAGMSLDGNQTGGAARSAKISNSVIDQSIRSSFVITSLSDGKYSIKGHGNDKYIDPKDTEITYQNSSASLQIEHEGDGFVIRREAGANDSKYIVYEGGAFTGKKNATDPSRKLYIYREVDLTKQVAHMTLWSEGDWVTKGQTINTGVWTDHENGRISYRSSDTSIATVDANGVVTGVNPGDVDILAVVHEDNNYYSTSSCVTITVMEDYTDPQLTFGPQGGVTEIAVKSILRTESSHRGGGVVVYTSSDPTVADIDANGVIRTYNVGHTVLTAKLSADGYYTEASKSFMLTVVKGDPLVTPSFTSKSISVGETTNLLLTTESTGQHHFSSEDEGLAKINANGVITAVGVGTVKLYYWVDECDNYNASTPQYVTLIITQAAKKTPHIEITPDELVMPVGGSMRVHVIMSDFGGQYNAALEENTDIAEMLQINRAGFEASYVVTGLRPGQTYITFSFPETDDYYGLEKIVPVTVLDIYQYSLVLKTSDASLSLPKGISVEIMGVTHTKSETFNSSRSDIGASDVHVKSLPGYTSSVSVSDRTITVTFGLKEVAKGTFIRLRNYNSNLYATLSADGTALGMAPAGLNNIIYLDKDGHLLFYQNGQYVKNTNQMAAVGESGSTYTFTRGTDDFKECFDIKSNANKYLMGSSNGTSTGGSPSGSEYAYWYVEELTELPVSVTTAGYGYATIYCPVALNISGGAAAYYVSRKVSKTGKTGVEYWLTLSPFKSSIPANTPAVIVGIPGTTYQFGLTDTYTEPSFTQAAGITGHVAASLTSSITGKVFTLQPNSQEEKVGFYPWNNSVTSGFKAYFTSSNNEAAYYRLVFEDEDVTDIHVEVVEDSVEMIYDLCGRPVGTSIESLSQGIYVKGGRKFIVK